MKLQKLLKKLALPVFALAVVGMLAACSSPSGGGSGSGSGGQNNTPGSTTPLVDESEVTVSASKIELSDGNWSYKEIRTESDGDQSIKDANLTVSENGTVIVYTAIKSTHTGTIPEGASDKDIADAQAMGYIINGNTFTVVENYSAEDLEKKNEHTEYDFSDSSFKNIKTNSDKTKYSWTKEGTTYDSREDSEKGINGRSYTTKCYLVKTSSASSSDANKGEGEGHKPQGGESGGNTGTTTGGKYKIEDELLGTMTVIAGNDGTYVVKAQGMTVEEGKYVLNGDKVTTTTTKELNEAFELVSVTKPTTTTYTIGANNVLTEYKGSSGTGTDTGTGTGTDTSQSGGSTNTETIDGTYEGTITGAGNSLYASVEISGKTYSVKMWTSSAKTGNPFQTSSGTISTTQKTVKGMMFGGTGTDHTFTAQPNGNNGWTVTIILFSGSSYSGTMTKGSSGSNGGEVAPVNPNNPGTTIPEGEFPFDSSNMYFIKYGNENPVPVPADYVDEILKGLSASDYDKDDTNKTITLKSEAAAETVMSKYESVIEDAMLAAGYEPMDD